MTVGAESLGNDLKVINIVYDKCLRIDENTKLNCKLIKSPLVENPSSNQVHIVFEFEVQEELDSKLIGLI